MPEGYYDNPQDYPWDSCTTGFTSLFSMCVREEAPEPLCEVCTVELQLPGAEKLCLFGNNLRPREKETLMHTSWDMPYTAQQDEVVYATELANQGCSVSDYAGLAGKILLVPETGRCTLVMTVRNAEEAGAKAYILVSAPYYLQWYRVRAYSHHTSIPVHTVDFHATRKLQAFVSNGGGRHIPGSGYALDAMSFTRGEPPPSAAPTPAPLPAFVVDTTGPQLDTSPDFELSAGAVVCIVVVCVDLVVLAVLVVRQRRDAAQLPLAVRVNTFSIPLKVVSLGLSLTLLLLIAVATFSLTYTAGKESTDKALENGKSALVLAHDNSEKNTVDLYTIRTNAVNRVLVLLQREIVAMEHRLKMMQDMFFEYNGSWSQFDARFIDFLRMQRNVDTTTESIRSQVFTTRGFFMNMYYKTDDRSDELRTDGVNGSVADTQEGWRYGVNRYTENLVTRKFRYDTTIPVYQHNASRVFAGSLGDPLAVTSGQVLGHTTWLAARVTFPLEFQDFYPMSAYRPLYNGAGEYHGTIEVLTNIAGFITGALFPNLHSDAVSAITDPLLHSNMTVLVVDTVDRAILGASNVGTTGSLTHGFAHVQALEPFYGLVHMHTHPSVRVAALANYLDDAEEWTSHAGEFDQQQHYREQPHMTLVKVAASGGRAADTGVHNWNAEMRDGGCGACVMYDAQLQKEVLAFDGATTLHIYRNMTRRTPIVAQSQVSGPGEPWRSRYEAFSETLTHTDGTECVANSWRPTATESVKRCLLRPDVSMERAYTVSLRIRPDVRYTETTPHATTPRLFSDSLVGDANVRLFANGQLYLFVLRYGCRTKAFDGGFPVDAWTTVTAVVGDGRCRVYVNGTLYDSGQDMRKAFDTTMQYYHIHYNVRTHANPYRTGQFFKGRIDSLHVVRHLGLNSREVSLLHTQDRLVRDVPSVRYFAQTKTLDMNGVQRAGVRWTVAVLVPRDDIMRVVDANRRSTLVAVQAQEDNTNKELTQKANATIMVIVAIAATSMVVFMVFNNLMTRPFEQTAAIMAQAAVMRLDSVPQGTSLITELGAMNTAIRLMLDNLRLYKSFMPQSVQLEKDCATDDGNVSQSSSSSDSGKTSASNSSRTGDGGQRLHCLLGRKKFTYVVLNVRGWHGKIQGTVDESTIALHAALLDTVLQSCLKHRGVSEVFSGDRFACSFNAAKVATQHKVLGCACLLQCAADLSEMSLDTSASAVSGEGRVGNIGNATMRRFSFLTPVITWGHALERLCCMLEAGILVDPAVHRDAQHAMLMRLVDVVSFKKVADVPLRVHQVLGPKEAGRAEEWMYELARAERSDPMAQWNKCAGMIVDGNFEDAEWISGVIDTAPPAAARLQECFRTRCRKPFQIILH